MLRVLPEQARFAGSSTAGRAHNLKHIREGAAVRRFGNEDGASQQEDEEGDAQTHGGDDVAHRKAQILLEVRDAPQREDGPQVNTPVEPVKEPPRRFWTTILHLRRNRRKLLLSSFSKRCC